MMVLILAAQRHDDELATRREQLAVLNERKAAKIIAMLEGRLQDPQRSNERDKETEAMATPADPQAVLDAIKSTHRDGSDRQ